MRHSKMNTGNDCGTVPCSLLVKFL